METITAVVLAAGKGTRMESELPKVLCQANGRTLLDYVIEALQTSGVNRFVVVVGYRAEDVKASLAGRDEVEFALQLDQLGTGHAVMMCREHLAKVEGPVIVVAGDSPMLQPASLEKLIDDYREKKPACILGTLEMENPFGCGRIVRDADGKFHGIVEEKDANDAQKQITEVNMSTYLFDCQKMLRALDELTDDNQQSEYYITDLPAILLSKNEDVRALPVLDPIEALSVNTKEHLAKVEQAMIERANQ